MINLREYALRLITVKDRTKKEIIGKLREKNYDDTEIEKEIEFLQSYGYINDEKYAEKFVLDAINLKKWGKRRIESELLHRGISKDTVSDVIERLFPEDVRERLVGEIERRYKGADLSNIKERTRIFNYYARRGFSVDEIKGALNSLCAFNDITD